MARDAALSDRQLALLRRLASDGEPLSKSDSRLATSIYALRGLGLVRTSSAYNYASAVLTDAGREALATGHVPARERAPLQPSVARARPTRGPLPISGEQLVDEVVAAGGTLRISDPTEETRSAWRRAIAAVVTTGLAPAGYTLRHTGRDTGDLTIRLTPAADPSESPPEPPPTIAVPERLAKLHPVLDHTHRDARAGKDGWIDTRHRAGVVHVRIAKQSLRRVLLLAQALVNEATDRGYSIGIQSGYGCPGGLAVTIDGFSSELVFIEETDRTPHEATRSELQQAERYEWMRVPEWDRVASGRIVLRSGHGDYQATLATDRKRWRIEDRLGRALATMEERAESARLRRLEEQRAAEERERAWAAAMAHARVQFIEATKAEVLRRQLDEFRFARDVRELVKQLRRGDPSPDPEWVAWAERHATQLDPVGKPFVMPDVPEPSPEQLKPYLRGFSPYGPTRW